MTSLESFQHEFKPGFGSDNHSGVHPALMQALLDVNHSHAPSYGTDPVTHAAEEHFKKQFGPRAQTFFVFNGTAANVVSLRSLVRPHQSIVASDQSHLHWDECGAPEFFTGSKLLLCNTHHGKITPESLQSHLVRRGDQHYSQPRVLSLTQPTELGTVYTVSELKILIALAKENGLLVHIDGARIANAALQLKASFAEFTTDLGVDIVSFGGTKNGLMFGEAVVCLTPEAAQSMKYLRKQCAQLPSKTRFVSAQFLAYFQNDVWREIAMHSLQMAQELRKQLETISALQFLAPTESNAVFVQLPQKIVKKLKEKFFFYVWDEKTFSCRLMTTWDTNQNDINGLVTELKHLLQTQES